MCNLYLRLARENIAVNEEGKYVGITTVADKKGPATSLSSDIETKIRIFIEECYDMGIPRSKGKLALDIQQYLKKHNIDVPRFQDHRPGNFSLSTSCFTSMLLVTRSIFSL